MAGRIQFIVQEAWQFGTKVFIEVMFLQNRKTNKPLDDVKELVWMPILKKNSFSTGQTKWLI